MNALELKKVSKSFSGFYLDNISFTLPSGCIMGLIGENGAGKSTTIKLILDMLHKDTFFENYKRYYYQTNDNRINVGDYIVVPVGESNGNAELHLHTARKVLKRLVIGQR